MRSDIFAITTAPQTAAAITSWADSNCNEVIIQAPTANTAVLNFGAPSHEVGELFAGNAIIVAVNSLKNVSVKGTSGDYVIIMAT